ncbi:APO protein 3, mitochondrial-like protein [Drosera capensis]
MALRALPKWRIHHPSLTQSLRYQSMSIHSSPSSTAIDIDAPSLYTDLPRKLRSKSERKPYPTPMKLLIRRAKQEKQLMKENPYRVLEHPPENGLLVPELVDVAHRVYRARESLVAGVSKLVRMAPVLRCRFCFEVHVGPVGHQIRTCTGPKSGLRRATHVWRRGNAQDVVYFPSCFHLNDRVGRPRVLHDERSIVKRIPAIVELCVQAGVDLEKYPVKRRTKPVYSIEGRIADFEPETDLSSLEDDTQPSNSLLQSDLTQITDASEPNSLENTTHSLSGSCPDENVSKEDFGVMMLDSWFEMISGAKKIMEKYTVWTCGYCPEVQVGPKGHKVRMCTASKHQSRDGMHAWQEATIDDLIGPNYVWHVQDPHGPPLDNNLKRYYGKAPALVELCVQAGAPVPHAYCSMMRLDVVPPDRDEADLVA